MKDQIYSCTGVEPELQELVYESDIPVIGSDAEQHPLEIEIANDHQVENMFLSARKGQEKRVRIIV